MLHSGCGLTAPRFYDILLVKDVRAPPFGTVLLSSAAEIGVTSQTGKDESTLVRRIATPIQPKDAIAIAWSGMAVRSKPKSSCAIYERHKTRRMSFLR